MFLCAFQSLDYFRVAFIFSAFSGSPKYPQVRSSLLAIRSRATHERTAAATKQYPVGGYHPKGKGGPPVVPKPIVVNAVTNHMAKAPIPDMENLMSCLWLWGNTFLSRRFTYAFVAGSRSGFFGVSGAGFFFGLPTGRFCFFNF